MFSVTDHQFGDRIFGGCCSAVSCVFKTESHGLLNLCPQKLQFKLQFIIKSVAMFCRNHLMPLEVTVEAQNLSTVWSVVPEVGLLFI